MDRYGGGGGGTSVLPHRTDGTGPRGMEDGNDDDDDDPGPLLLGPPAASSAVLLRTDSSVLLLEARLQGGAPWGFTLKGGLEHGEPLIISKVEEGGKADCLEHPLQAGDEMIIINDVELSGFRQEAISLVKGSYKTLQLTIRRECCAGSYFEVSGDLPPSFCAPPPPPPPPAPPPPPPHLTRSHRDSSRSSSASGVRLRIKNRHSEPASRPHSWHSTKLGESREEDPGMVQLSQGGISTMGTPWHHPYNTSASTTDLAEAGFDSGGSYLRKSPDQYSSRGSMDSLDPPPSSSHHHQYHHHHHHHHPAGPPHPQHPGGPHPAYSSCHQLSYARSSNSIDHLHSKRDSAYSSFSTSSSIPEYLAAAPSPFSPERSYSLETVPQRGGGGGGGEMQQADIRYVRTVYDPQQGLSQEHELSSASAAFLGNSESRGGGGGVKSGLGRELQGSGGVVCYRSSNSSSSSSSSSSGGGGGGGAPNRHSVGPIWGPAARRSSYESLKGVPAPPQRSDSYAAIKNHERPNSWSSLEHARSLRSLHKGSWHHSSGSVSSAKGSYAADGQLHTVIEKSPESSPTTKPRQGGAGTPQLGPQPPGAPAGTTQSGRPMLPTGVYPVPQPEPHYAHMPGSAPGSGVYPALAKESSRASRQQQQRGPQGAVGVRDGGGAEQGWRDGRVAATENGYQASSSSSVSLTSTQLRAPAQETDRPHLQPTAASGASEGQDGPPRPQNHLQGPHGQSSQWPYSQSLQGTQTFSSQYQTSHQDVQGAGTQWNHQGHRTLCPQAAGQERRDPFTTVQPRGDRSRIAEAPGLHPGPAAGTARVAQGQVASSPPPQQPPQPPPPQTHAEPRAPPPPPSSRRHHHAEMQAEREREHEREREREREQHPLTRLEMALAEVQRCASPDSVLTTTGQSQSNSYGYGDGSQGNDNSGSSSNHGPAVRSLSVLEKVSRFERRSLKQRSQSTGQEPGDKAGQHKISPCGTGTEDLRNMLERSTGGAKAHRTLSYRGDRGHHTQHRNPDPSFALQRSRSTFQLGETEEGESSHELPRRGEPPPGESSREFPWRQEIQELLGSIQDTSFNRTYRDSLKDAQSKVLSSTSFRRRELSASTSPPPPPSASPFSDKQPPTPASLSPQPQPQPKHHSLDRKGPKTMPKPQGCVVLASSPPRYSPPPSSSATSSPHTPRERHVVSPEVRGQSPPALPSLPPVGQILPPAARICGRKRLTMEQKKRSYSEPESMHEVGVYDTENASLFRRGGETSVADRRRMFELAASRSVGASSSSSSQSAATASSRPDLRQLQQDALAEYVERKRGRRREDGGGGGGGAQGRRGQRPRSAYLQPESHSHADTLSLSSTSSLLSLQDPTPERSLCPGERRLCSTLPPGADLHSFQTNLIYPGRVTAPRASASGQHTPIDGPGSYVEASDIHPPAQDGTAGQGETSTRGSGPCGQRPHRQQASAGPEGSQGLSQHFNGAPERSGPGRGSGRSASAEDLLERSEERPVAPQHHRSRSSPTVDTPNQRFHAGDLRMFGVFTTRPGRLSPTDRPTGTQRPERPTSATSSSPSHHQINIGHTHSSTGPAQDPALSHPPAVTRRERQRNVDRQRAVSASNLAASVGLPCPFSPPPGGGGANSEWHASERLSQANLDAIAFPCSPRTSTAEGDGRGFRKDVYGAVSRHSEAGREAASSPAGGCDSDSSANGVKAFSPSGASAFSPSGASAFSPNAASAFSPSGASAFSPSGASAFSPSGASAFSPSGASAFSPSGASAFSPSGASAFSPSGASAFSPSGASAFSAAPAEENLETRLDVNVKKRLSDSGNVDTRREFRGERLLSFDRGNEECCEEVSLYSDHQQRLSSLRISESSPSGSAGLSHPTEPRVGQSQESFDEVFFEGSGPPVLPPSPPPPPPPPPIRETDITEDDVPPPPPPPPPGHPFSDSSECIDDLEPSETRPSVHCPSSRPSSSISFSFSPVVSVLPPASPSTPVTPPPSPDCEEDRESVSLLQYLPLPRRERSSQEQRVEALARQLVLREPSLAPILDTWAGKSTLDLMEELFPSSGLAGRSAWQRRGSSQLDDRIQDGVYFDGHAHSPVAERGLETDLDEEEKDVNVQKMELCEALRLNMDSLREEKDVLTEEQRSHQTLGSSLDTLVQEHCKANERDKYRTFIGDLEKIVNLLLSLCGRLARIDRALSALDTQEHSQDNTDEKDSLLQKRSQLISQTEDARELKENLERRQRAVHAILSACLAGPHLRDYRRFVRAKPSLLIRQRHLDDLARQGEELLERLSESLPPGLTSGNSVLSAEHPFLSSGPIDHRQHHHPLPSSLLPGLVPGLVPGHAHSVRSTTTVTSL